MKLIVVHRYCKNYNFAMKIQLPLILTAYIVEIGWASVLPQNQQVDEAVINEVNGESKIRENFQNLFNSITGNNGKKSGVYHEILKEEVAKERQVFDAMKGDLWVAQNRNAHKKRRFYGKSDDSENFVAIKREAHHRHSGTTGIPPIKMWENFQIENFEVLPEVIVMDGDFSLWPFLFDFHAEAPFRVFDNGTVWDNRNRRVSYYRGVPEMLEYLHERHIKIGIVNHTKKPEDLKQLLNALGWMKYLSYIMFHAGEVGSHVKDMVEKERLELRNVLYFDELPINLAKTERLGIISALAEYGMNPDSLRNGLTQYVDRYKNPRTRSREEIFDEATAGRIRIKATTPISPWTSRTTASYYFVCTPVSEPL